MTLEAYRSDDESAVDEAEAREAWNRAARPVLVQVARRYGSLTTPSDFAEAVQALAGVRTREPADAWVGDVLDAVGVECVARAEPLLSAFCVGPEGRMDKRYEQIATGLDPSAATDIEMHAATQRLEAHRYHGAVLPVDGGQPVLPPQLAKVRASAPKSTRTARAKAPAKTPAPRKVKKPEPPPRPVCPTCFLQLPATGQCDNCNPQ
jgi:hypothetical protein